MRLRNVSFLTVLLFGLCGLVSLSWYTAFSSSRGKNRAEPSRTEPSAARRRRPVDMDKVGNDGCV